MVQHAGSLDPYNLFRISRAADNKVISAGHPPRLGDCSFYLRFRHRFVLVIACCLFFFNHDAVAEDSSSHAMQQDFTRGERRWAVKWIDRELSFWMGKGVVSCIKTDGKRDVFDVYIGPQWYGLSLVTRGEFLRNLSRARLITGHSPCFMVYDESTRECVAQVSRDSITVELPGEGFFEYLPQPEKGSGAIGKEEQQE